MKEEHIKELRCPVRSVVYHISRCAGVMSARRGRVRRAERAASHRSARKDRKRIIISCESVGE